MGKRRKDSCPNMVPLGISQTPLGSSEVPSEVTLREQMQFHDLAHHRHSILSSTLPDFLNEIANGCIIGSLYIFDTTYQLRSWCFRPWFFLKTGHLWNAEGTLKRIAIPAPAFSQDYDTIVLSWGLCALVSLKSSPDESNADRARNQDLT